eukprot:TRINITY_DN2665_c0_g1_i1.p1 TRINITY_DN2665_c0_g1~~TRINITY_DN2665_c0_g1_i1.p1  ORF type:complete len:797 (-),score=187.76 TRINITY_DN2665_c0_g1_i1:39-2429(-)
MTDAKTLFKSVYDYIIETILTDYRYVQGLCYCNDLMNEREGVDGLFEICSVNESFQIDFVIAGLYSEFELFEENPSHGILRMNSIASGLLGKLTNLPYCKYYLDYTFNSLVDDILNDPDFDIEVDPKRMYKIEDEEEKMKLVERHFDSLTAWATLFLDKMTDDESIERLPAAIKIIAAKMVLFSKQIGEFSEELFARFLGAMISLRFITPAIAMPDALYVTTRSDFTNEHRRGFLLISKLMQAIANAQKFEIKEAFLKPMNHWIEAKIPQYQAFLLKVAEAGNNIITHPTRHFHSLSSGRYNIKLLQEFHKYIYCNREGLAQYVYSHPKDCYGNVYSNDTTSPFEFLSIIGEPMDFDYSCSQHSKVKDISHAEIEKMNLIKEEYLGISLNAPEILAEFDEMVSLGFFYRGLKTKSGCLTFYLNFETFLKILPNVNHILLIRFIGHVLSQAIEMKWALVIDLSWISKISKMTFTIVERLITIIKECLMDELLQSIDSVFLLQCPKKDSLIVESILKFFPMKNVNFVLISSWSKLLEHFTSQTLLLPISTINALTVDERLPSFETTITVESENDKMFLSSDVTKTGKYSNDCNVLLTSMYLVISYKNKNIGMFPHSLTNHVSINDESLTLCSAIYEVTVNFNDQHLLTEFVHKFMTIMKKVERIYGDFKGEIESLNGFSKKREILFTFDDIIIEKKNEFIEYIDYAAVETVEIENKSQINFKMKNDEMLSFVGEFDVLDSILKSYHAVHSVCMSYRKEIHEKSIRWKPLFKPLEDMLNVVSNSIGDKEILMENPLSTN